MEPIGTSAWNFVGEVFAGNVFVGLEAWQPQCWVTRQCQKVIIKTIVIKKIVILVMLIILVINDNNNNTNNNDNKVYYSAEMGDSMAKACNYY